MRAPKIKATIATIHHLHKEIATLKEIIKCSFFLHNLQNAEQFKTLQSTSPFSNWTKWLDQKLHSPLTLNETMQIIQIIDYLLAVESKNLHNAVDLKVPILPKILHKIAKEILNNSPYSFLLKDKVQQIIQTMTE